MYEEVGRKTIASRKVELHNIEVKRGTKGGEYEFHQGVDYCCIYNYGTTLHTAGFILGIEGKSCWKDVSKKSWNNVSKKFANGLRPPNLNCNIVV